ncbi:hypothetical protein C5Z26_04340 [Lactobacillus sp. CBA3606]|uniref:hypothetical protein n=1 Tax=Lactobacillus sp. CBA3606 TaxID=2099789 RepID=UPI000CFCAEA3|nr:hypothetical protein [Lactobacillus sp. CBA3606]AVK63376.1 hypothetical protein C5Z26_04340 [Lactobacillus sp. CBA3606]
MDLTPLLRAKATATTLLAGRFGIEREGQRIIPAGRLALTAFPTELYDELGIGRDFAETQLELVTPITTSPTALMASLMNLHQTTQRALTPDELIWPLSMPPALPVLSADIPIAQLADARAVAYRQHLAQRYGRRRQMLCGVHFNYEFSPRLMDRLFQQQTGYATLSAFKTAMYLKMARNYLRYRWFVTYLFGATPISESHFFDPHAGPKGPVRSIRNSHYGYHNQATIKVSYASFDHYWGDLQALVDQGKLSGMQEFYGAVRLRGGQRITDVKRTGVQYLEIRHLDLNPMAVTGIRLSQVQFLQLFLITMLILDEPQAADDWVAVGDQRNQQTALTAPLAPMLFSTEGHWLMQMLQAVVQQFKLPGYEPLLTHLAEQLRTPSQTVAGQWWQLIQGQNQQTVATTFAKRAQKQILNSAKINQKFINS